VQLDLDGALFKESSNRHCAPPTLPLPAHDDGLPVASRCRLKARLRSHPRLVAARN
jgi:hypothetical protein